MLFYLIYLYGKVLADDVDEENLNNDEVYNIIETFSKNLESQPSVETSNNINKELTINSRSAIIYNRETKQVLWGKNENDRRAMASTTKIMTAIVVLENSNLEDIVTISKKAAGTGGSVLKIKEGDKITVNDLLYGLMLRSRK